MEAVVEQLSDYERERGKPMPTLNHAYVQANLLVELKTRYCKTYTVLSELNLTMPERTDAVPDIAIYPKLEIDFLHDVTSMIDMPLTAIEIVSPSQSDAEILAKFERYFKAGVKSCWLVMPSFKAISVYSEMVDYKFFKQDEILADPVAAIQIPLNEVFV